MRFNYDLIEFLLDIVEKKPDLIKAHWKAIMPFFIPHADYRHDDYRRHSSDCHHNDDYGTGRHFDHKNPGQPYLDRFPAYVKES
jgi:hypothetical protein